MFSKSLFNQLPLSTNCYKPTFCLDAPFEARVLLSRCTLEFLPNSVLLGLSLSTSRCSTAETLSVGIYSAQKYANVKSIDFCSSISHQKSFNLFPPLGLTLNLLPVHVFAFPVDQEFLQTQVSTILTTFWSNSTIQSLTCHNVQCCAQQQLRYYRRQQVLATFSN